MREQAPRARITRRTRGPGRSEPKVQPQTSRRDAVDMDRHTRIGREGPDRRRPSTPIEGVRQHVPNRRPREVRGIKPKDATLPLDGPLAFPTRRSPAAFWCPWLPGSPSCCCGRAWGAMGTNPLDHGMTNPLTSRASTARIAVLSGAERWSRPGGLGPSDKARASHARTRPRIAGSSPSNCAVCTM